MSLKNIYVWEPDPFVNKEVYDYFIRKINKTDMGDKLAVIRSPYIGLTSQTPIIRVPSDGTVYSGFEQEDLGEIFEAIIHNKKVERFLFVNDSENLKVPEKDECSKQFKLALRNIGYMDPEYIEEYISRGGYSAMEKALFDMKPEDIIQEMKISGLRGRGGAGYPTALKWQNTRNSPGEEKYVICNADEGDPGAYMDRSVLEGDPHTILEGMIIGALAVGNCHEGYIYVRAEYPLAISRLEKALADAREYGLLGDNILGSDFCFDIELRWGAGAFVCGEETALISSIEGKRGNPKPKPPFPSQAGILHKPTFINNVETWASVPVVIEKGGEWFSKIGTEKSKGTKVFAVTGKVENPGLIEVPMGTTLREIVYDICGGIKDDKKIKAVQTGGPSGGVIPEEHLDMPIDYESLQSIGSMMGSGGLIVMDEDDCMVDVNKFYLQFSVDESCGKCAPCRIGGKQLLDLITRVTEGKGELKDVQKIRNISLAMSKASLCALGQSTPNPVLSALNFFEGEYMEHITDKKCRTGKCKDLTSFIINDKCIGCGVCAKKCPASCIEGERKAKHVIDQDQCVKCGECLNACKFNAVTRR